MVAVVGLFVVLGWFFVCCLCLPSRFRDHFSSLQERTTVGAVMARTAWEKKKICSSCSDSTNPGHSASL